MAKSLSSREGRLANKVAIITGSSSGFGRAIALAYGREGARVVCADITPNARHEIEHETIATTLELLHKVGFEATSFKADVSKAEDMRALVEHAVQHFGRLDILVNNAGISLQPSILHETSEDSFDRTMNINARSVFLGTKYAITQMLKQEPHSSGDRGWIINIASVAALVGCAATPSYSASKGAVLALTRQTAVDYSKHRIHCNAICPGYTQTALLTEAFTHVGDRSEHLARLHPFRGLGEPEDLTGPAVFLASADSRWMTGAPLVIDGGYTAQ